MYLQDKTQALFKNYLSLYPISLKMPASVAIKGDLSEALIANNGYSLVKISNAALIRY